MSPAYIKASMDDIFVALAELNRIPGFHGERAIIRQRIEQVRDRLMFAWKERPKQETT